MDRCFSLTSTAHIHTPCPRQRRGPFFRIDTRKNRKIRTIRIFTIHYPEAGRSVGTAAKTKSGGTARHMHSVGSFLSSFLLHLHSSQPVLSLLCHSWRARERERENEGIALRQAYHHWAELSRAAAMLAAPNFIIVLLLFL